MLFARSVCEKINGSDCLHLSTPVYRSASDLVTSHCHQSAAYGENDHEHMIHAATCMMSPVSVLRKWYGFGVFLPNKNQMLKVKSNYEIMINTKY